MVSNGSRFRPDMVSGGFGKVKEPENPKEVESVADKVADEVDTVDEVVEKIEEPIVESNAVESDSLNEPNENNEKTPKPVPKEEALEPDSVNTFWSQDPITKKWSIVATDSVKEFPRNRPWVRPSKVDQVTNP